LLQWLSRKEQYTLAFGAMKVVWLCGLVSALLAVISGFFLSGNGEYEEDAVAWHMWMGIATTAATLLVCAKVFTRQFDVVYKVASITLLLLIFVTGHLGGTLTHGADFLTSGLNNAAEENTVIIKPIKDVQEAAVYADVVQPLLQTKCYSCHGPKKQKGKLRLDEPTFIQKGGKNGAVIEAGKADKSELIKRLLLPREEEHHMPPKEKPQLSEKQIALLHWWVEQGAPFDKKVKELPQSEKIKSYLLSLQSAEIERKATTNIPSEPVEKGDEKAIQALKERGVVILPVAQNSNYLMANFVTATDLTDKDLALLLPLKKQLVWIKLNDAPIGDSALAIISQCTNLTSLQLSGTRITDKGLVQLKKLNNLQYLNLVGTNISLQGLNELQPLKKLQSLYLYQTRITKEEEATLRKIFPRTFIDLGGYNVPSLPTDTEKVKPPPVKK
ncbi:MAG: hypothetical protein ICV79_26720, partial [Flavisolibacter sp.]|nr:hypothetical protein [Flavisolibacter sp.]